MSSILLIFCIGIFVEKAKADSGSVCYRSSYFYGPTGTISSPNYPNEYSDSLDCTVYISVSYTDIVVITFFAFNTEANLDYVTITCYSGSNFASPLYSGTEIPAVLKISSCHLVQVNFHTDSSVPKSGFSLAYGVTTACTDTYFSGPTGTISSPNHPNDYANNLDCYSYISLSSGHTVIITFVSFLTQSSYDLVTITCASGTAFTSSQYSGSNIPAALTISSCSLVKVYFHSDGSTAYSGFSLTYNIPSVCQNGHFSSPTGRISSPNHPNAYVNNLDCYDYISVPSGHSVNIAFAEFSTQSYYDWVQITCANGKAFTSSSYYGSSTPAALTISSCSLVRVNFRSDGSVTNTGFSLKYNTTSDCGNTAFSGSSGQISSPKFPMAYSNSLDCSSDITVSSGHAIIITFLSFTFEPGCGWVTITCYSGNTFTSPRYTGSQIPAVLTISSCYRVRVSFHTDGSVTNTGFSLNYNITPDVIIGGFTTKPTNAFPRSDKDDHVVFNCTTTTEYLPWWTINDKTPRNYTITNSTCGVINSAPYSNWYRAETLGPGSCNLIVTAPANNLYLLAGSFTCTDSTLSSARAILAPVNLELSLTTGMISSAIVSGIIGDDEIRISCNPSFKYEGASSSLLFTYTLINEGSIAQMRIIRTYWTSQGKFVSSIDASNTSSYVLVKAPVGVIPPYTCNIVCELFSNISDNSANFTTIELPFSSDPVEVEVLYKTYKNLKLQVLILGAMLGATTITIIIILIILFRRRHLQPKQNTAAVVGHECDANEHELQERDRESNIYANECGNAAADDHDEVEYHNLESSRERLPSEPELYQNLRPNIKK